MSDRWGYHQSYINEQYEVDEILIRHYRDVAQRRRERKAMIWSVVALILTVPVSIGVIEFFDYFL